MNSQPVDDSSTEAKIRKLKEENDKLRALLGNSSKDCAYCGLPATDQAKCQFGFPGCNRADDQMLSKHFAAGHQLEQQAAEIERLTQALKAIRLHVKITAGTTAPMSSVYQIAEQALAGRSVSVPTSDGEG